VERGGAFMGADTIKEAEGDDVCMGRRIFFVLYHRHKGAWSSVVVKALRY
jgi:hypothetical protein